MNALNSPLADAYQALFDVASAQKRALAADDVEGYQSLGDRRVAAFEAIRRLEGEAGRLAAEPKSRILALIPQIIEIDHDIEAHVDRLTERGRSELTQLHHGLRALQSYLPAHVRQQAVFIDRSR